MKRHSVTRLLILLTCTLAALSVSCLPSDRALIERFRRQRADFETLKDMVLKDQQVHIVQKSWFRLKGEDSRYVPTKDFPIERWNEYRRLFEKLDLAYGIARRWSYPFDGIEFGVRARGALQHGDAKGYVFTETAVHPLVDAIDQRAKKLARTDHMVFRKLEEHWYIFYEIE